ncbi:MAG: hypothetical protein EOO77_07110 [Oxalobacteraceae bacterium]|nr:MAG: hypothetical protein EOO77_07110 [Oxalobacteraceae bacterium]
MPVLKLTDNLFKKALFFTDIHYGRNGNSPQSLLDNMEFLAWAIEEGKTRGCDTFIFGGDWHDNRHSLHVSTMHASLEGLQMVNDAFPASYFIPGNHDLFYRDKRDISSIEFIRNLPNIKLIRGGEVIELGVPLWAPVSILGEYKLAIPRPHG